MTLMLVCKVASFKPTNRQHVRPDQERLPYQRSSSVIVGENKYLVLILWEKLCS